jgi:transglutaminase-like putative cysteine protease
MKRDWIDTALAFFSTPTPDGASYAAGAIATNVPLAARRPIPDFLRPTPYIDHEHAAVRALVEARGWRGVDPVSAARAAFAFVRDEVHHSCDANSRRVTRTASDALIHREGLCFAKSHLLVAVLRHLGLPSGLAYQRLTKGDGPESGYVVHGLATVLLDQRWIRLDARGNKPGVKSEFSLVDERLAFTIRPELSELDYEKNFSDVHPAVARALESGTDLHEILDRLPDSL